MDYGRLELSKREIPHTAIITFDIDIRALDASGGLDKNPISDKRLLKYNIGRVAKIVVSGVSEAECVENVKLRLEKLNE